MARFLAHRHTRFLNIRVSLPILLLVNLAYAGVTEARTEPDETPDESTMPILGVLGIGPAMDAAIEGTTLYVIGGGKLYVADASSPRSPRLLGTVSGLGNVRQIHVEQGVAFITAREDGLFLVDVTKSDRPRIMSHYDTIELATGVTVTGEIAAVACRTAGVELIDISDPASPMHLSTIRTGEAQSIDVRDGFLYAGVWASRELVVCDISNPRQPSVVARAPLDGYGDGVDVHGSYCYVATGHHSRLQPRAESGDPGFGSGHGLEIFDVSDPRSPRFAGRVKFPAIYRLGMDMWDVTVIDHYAFVADTYNGVFVVDISHATEPKIIARRRLPCVPGREDPGPVGGLAVGDGVIYAAGAWSDLHVIEAPTASLPSLEPDAAPSISVDDEPTLDPRFRVYKPEGQVHSVAIDGDIAYVAAGAGGLHTVQFSPELRRLEVQPTEGFAFDAAVSGQLVFVAEGTGGLSIWKQSLDGTLEIEGSYRVEDKAIRQVVVGPKGEFVLLHVGQNSLHIVDVRDPTHPILVLQESHVGLFYTAPISRQLLENRYANCHWHVSGMRWYDLAGDEPAASGRHYPFRIGSRNGAAAVDSQELVTCRGGYVFLSRTETRPPEQIPLFRVPQTTFHGKPTVHNDILFTSERNSGIVTAIDISVPENPKLLDRIQLNEHPGLIVVHEGVPVIPAGNQGLLLWDSCSSRISGDGSLHP
jgi:hypothetical protein